ncbi:hypothetical protein [Sediminimonas sp.]|uniref:hypothetical protein n=1 Tax=Sediminimonas sp. TaxID=2823379 RepID=UPI0025EF4F08|nr:hypothetical protein [Sediminimonas sp.]
MSTEHDPVIDLSRYHFKHAYGDVTVIGTWSLATSRPVMALVPTVLRPTHDRVTPCLVPLDMAWMWDETTGDAQHCVETTVMFAQALGFNPYAPRELIRLTSIIRDHLGDLLTMPPMPETEQRAVADVIKTDLDTGKTQEAEILSDV